jgi:hypothetical protein
VKTPKFTGWIGTPDGQRRVEAGERWPDDDPFVKDNPDLFEPLDSDGEGEAKPVKRARKAQS